MSQIDEILNSPDYFYCEKFRAKIKKLICIERQMGNNAIVEQYKTSEIGLSFEVCKSCNQGKTIRDELLMEKVKPCRGEGARHEECLYYDDCLDKAAKKDWKTYNCESCGLYKMINGELPKVTEDVKNTRVCKTPGCNNITSHPNFPYCHSCLDERKKNKIQTAVNNKPKGDKKAQYKEKPNKEHSMTDVKKASPGKDTALTIDFNGHPDLLEAIRGIADEELRPVDMQVIYMLKKQLQEARAQA
jgi:hypothetical protein